MDQETILSRSFYEKPTVEVAQALLGKRLVRTMPSGQQLSGMIVETEAYLGFRDPACHTYEGKKSKKNASMYLSGGYAYVYLIYGMYHCFNVVTLSEGEPEAVLIRALEPIDGIPQMRKYRQKVKKEKDLANGPGKLCLALGIDRSHDGLSLLNSEIVILDTGHQVKKSNIISSPRIGVDYAGVAAQWPLRYTITENPYISKKPLN